MADIPALMKSCFANDKSIPGKSITYQQFCFFFGPMWYEVCDKLQSSFIKGCVVAAQPLSGKIPMSAAGE